MPVLAFSYLYLTPKRSSPAVSSDNEARPIETPALHTNEVTEYTTAGLKGSDGPVSVSGFYQTIEPKQNVINGIAYPYVLGILGEDESIARIWLTDSQYINLNSSLTVNKIGVGDRVLVKITKDMVTIEKSIYY